MMHVKSILLAYGPVDIRNEYYNTILRYMAIARMTTEEARFVDDGIEWYSKNGYIQSMSDLFDYFVQICMLDKRRPLEYWSYLFGLKIREGDIEEYLA